MANNATPNTADRILRSEAVAARLGVSPAAVRKAASEGRIPAAVRILGSGARALGWRESDISAFIASRK